ncbi:carbohydrate-binding module family 1 protein [Serendipita vermifera MAFF 305830]|uniref:Carbohydrate-binding module family 1 protein n=1 Tax=Serendipita vermifera MAFF 305830 TaxID=933852 RepID=A0A0C3BM86_SERVB|nr:carbohydrate-binding module family 1 protein [Serendipita vermifera MAFF 305830]
MAFHRLAFLAALLYGAYACDVQQWAQCGGLQYTGDTQCAPGLVCHQWNPYYYQCIPSTDASTTVKSTTTTTTSVRITKTTTETTIWDTVPATMISTMYV